MTSIKSQNNKGKVQVSMIICEQHEEKHRRGINALQIDPKINRLYSAGRDSIIRAHENEKFIYSMQHHIDWVNDIILCCNGDYLISASSDTTVKVWNCYKGFCMSTLKTHQDYVKTLAYAKHKEMIASAGFDKIIYLWDIETLTQLTPANNVVQTSNITGCKESIYSLVMNPQGTLVISGSTEKFIRLWDPRSALQIGKLLGHNEIVKALVLSPDSTQCISGSSDGSIKVWNIAQQRCIQTILVHTDSVWALLVTENYSHVISGGRDKKVIMTDLKNIQRYVVVCTEEAPILKMCFAVDQLSIWVSTWASNLRCWKLPNDRHFNDEIRVSAQPVSVLQGGPAIMKATALNDKRHILTKDSVGTVALYDVLRACKIETLGQVNYVNEINDRNNKKIMYVPNWFNIDLKTGMLVIHLAQDEVDCFAAWVSSKDAGIKETNSEVEDLRINYGKVLLRGLFEHWRGIQVAEQDKVYFSIPKHIPIVISDPAGKIIYRLAVGEASSNNENSILNESVPKWVITNIEENNSSSKFTKVQFYLKPHDSVPANLLKLDKLKKTDRLVANDFIQCKKVSEHILDKLLGEGSVTSPGGDADNQNLAISGYTAEQIQLFCSEQLLEPSMDLRTVKHFMWKHPADLVLHYKFINK